MSSGPAPVLAAELIRWSWVGDHLDDIRGYLVQHVQLTGLAVLFGLLLAFPLALAAVQWPRLYGPILGFTGVLFTIPSLALFILLIPFTGLQIQTALIGLTIYTLLILVRNIVEGLRASTTTSARPPRRWATPGPASSSRSSCRWPCR